MAYATLGDALVLQRVVSHAETGSVQGVLLDRGYLVDTWLPAVAARHAPAGAAPRIVVTPPERLRRPLAAQRAAPRRRLCSAAPAPAPDTWPFRQVPCSA
jgi:hypothetical protein